MFEFQRRALFSRWKLDELFQELAPGITLGGWELPLLDLPNIFSGLSNAKPRSCRVDIVLRSHLDAGSVSHSGQKKLLRPLKHIMKTYSHLQESQTDEDDKDDEDDDNDNNKPYLLFTMYTYYAMGEARMPPGLIT